MLILLLSFSACNPFASGDDPYTYISDFPAPGDPTPDESHHEKRITLIVLSTLFSVVTVCTIALCCYKRATIVHILRPKPPGVEELAFADSNGLSEGTTSPDFRAHPSHMLLF
jgi:hypothetical protein